MIALFLLGKIPIEVGVSLKVVQKFPINEAWAYVFKTFRVYLK